LGFQHGGFATVFLTGEDTETSNVMSLARRLINLFRTLRGARNSGGSNESELAGVAPAVGLLDPVISDGNAALPCSEWLD
jgi:hypothetical protein